MDLCWWCTFGEPDGGVPGYTKIYTCPNRFTCTLGTDDVPGYTLQMDLYLGPNGVPGTFYSQAVPVLGDVPAEGLLFHEVAQAGLMIGKGG